ncbi:MAG TPA: zinc ribbon domain-containing protein [Caulifigura sp.]|nr:zinc ribbon domain-containing protein [Caulifigura sp.]
MPTYDYRCKKCGHTWETFQSIKAEPIKKCPECKKNQAERVIGPGAAILFKGSGFYLTDYRSDSYKKAAAADKPASSSEGSSGKSNGESKPAAKSESKSTPKKN